MFGALSRRRWLCQLAALLTIARTGDAAADARAPQNGSPLTFPADYGAHPATHTEWWYVTGWLDAGTVRYGMQVTFFRTRTGVAADEPSRFAATQLLFAHAAVSDLPAKRLRHDQRVARAGFGIAEAEVGDTACTLRDWSMRRDPASPGAYRCSVTSDTAGFAYDLTHTPTQPPLAQGDGGVSRKGPMPTQFSRYYSVPQLQTRGRLRLDGRWRDVTGRAWLDHEWSDAYLAPLAVGWDWLGMNLDDGSALMAFRIRRADGSVLYAGGSLRRAGDTAVRNFGPDEVQFTPGRVWTSPSSQARYPVEWALRTPVGAFRIAALMDDQELDSRGSTGAIYWEGVSDLRSDAGALLGHGYLEMTGYAGRLRMA